MLGARGFVPSTRVSSLSSPNLLKTPSSVDSSDADGSLSGRRVPSMVSAASGISAALAADAAEEFLEMRNSPLDDLTERLSRFSASRPRSVGRSWDRPPPARQRVSLLNGDPFRPEPVPSSPEKAKADYGAGDPHKRAAKSPAFDEEEDDAAVEDLVALSIALPPSDMTTASSPVGPRFSAMTGMPSSPPRIAQTPESAVKRKPVPTTTAATPKVHVYDDSKPPDTQPQTPADVSKSARRARGRSDTASQQRRTYPAQAMHYHDSTRARPNTSSSVGAMESETVGHTANLEHDRQTWIQRRTTDGTLDTTPPKEGRFERFLAE